MMASSIYIFKFPKLYINFLPSLMMIYPAMFVIMLSGMLKEYVYLFSRNMTEKEKHSWEQYRMSKGIEEDEIDHISFREACNNIYKWLTKPTQKSLLTISREIEDDRIKKGLEIHDVSELQDRIQEGFSDSSSSEDELPSFITTYTISPEEMKRRQEEIQNAISQSPRPQVMIIKNGEIVGYENPN